MIAEGRHTIRDFTVSFLLILFQHQCAENTRLGVIQPQWALMACAVSLRPHRKAEREPRPAEGRKDIATPPRSGLCPTHPATSRAAHLISAYLRAREDGPRGAQRQGATGSRVPKRGASPQGWPQRGLAPRGDGLAGPKTGCEPAEMAPEGPRAKGQRARGLKTGCEPEEMAPKGPRAKE